MVKAVRGAVQIEKDNDEAIFRGVTTLVTKVMGTTELKNRPSSVCSLQSPGT